MSKNNNYENIPISNETKKGMILTACDQQFLKRCFDRQDEVIMGFIKENNGKFLKKIEAQNRMIKAQNVIIKKIQGLIVNMRKELLDHSDRINKLEVKIEKLLTEHKKNHHENLTLVK